MRRLVIFLAVVLAVRLIVASQLGKHPLLQPDTGLDTTAYVQLAQRVNAGDPALGPGLYYVSPLYIYFLAVAKSVAAARIIQAVLGTFAVLFIFLTARQWFGERAAWISAILAGSCGVFAYYEALILQSSLDVFLTSAALWLLAIRRPLLAGWVAGLAALNRPNMLIAAIAVAVVLAAMRERRSGALLAAGVLIGIAPVTIRNLVVAHQFSLISSHGGINFYIGNGEGATGYFHAVPGLPSTVEGLAAGAHRAAEHALRRPLTDAEVSSYYSGLALTWMRDHPGAWLRLLARKAYAVVNTSHASTPFSYTFYAYDAGTFLRFLFLGPWLFVPLGIVGLIGRPGRRPHIAIAFALAYAASIVLFFITERYKLPLYVVLVIAAGAGVEALKRTSHAIVAVLLVIAANWPLRLDDGRAEERLRMAEYEASRGNVEETARWVNLTGMQNARTEYAIGRSLLASGRSGEAVPHLRRATSNPYASYDLAVALQNAGDMPGAAQALRDLNPPPDAPLEVWLQLGRRAAETNAPDVAEKFFRRAVDVAPANSRSHQALGLVLMAQGRCVEAIAEFNETLRLEPTNPVARKLIMQCGGSPPP
jgi:4-amino-4-deoxy-L-arabinose transferase-like glycosyltransferase